MVIASVILIIILAILLVLVVLAQDSKGGGLSGQFGGASQVMGVKRTGDVLETLTWSFMIGIMVIAVGSNLMSDKNAVAADAPTSINAEAAQAKPSAPAPASTPLPSTTPQPAADSATK